MNNFKDREKSFEKKFANDQETEFKINAKRNKLLGTWAASILKLLFLEFLEFNLIILLFLI